MRFFLILLISVLFVFNCSKDVVSPVPDPSEPLWENWLGIEKWTEEFDVQGKTYERPDSSVYVFVFKQDDTFRFRERLALGYGKYLITWWADGTYTYDPAREALTFYFDLGGKEITEYAPERGNIFTLWMVMFTKQDTLPEWTTYAETY